MTRTGWLLVILSTCVTCLGVHAQPGVTAVYAVPGETSIEGGTPAPELHYRVRIEGLADVRDGSVLVAYRRVPAARGTAAFRLDPVWLEAGRMQVLAVGNGWATARQISGTPHLLLPSLDADGLPLERICIGDRVVDTGQVGLVDQRVIGRFDLDLLFGASGDCVVEGGREALTLWLGRFAVSGAIQVDVSLPGEHPPSTGRPPTVDEAVSEVALQEGSGWSRVQRTEEELALAQRRARSLANAIETVLGREPGQVLATVSWTGAGASEARTATIRLGQASILPNLRPLDDGAARVGGGGAR